MSTLSPSGVSTIVQLDEVSRKNATASRLLSYGHPPNRDVEDAVLKVPFVAMLVAAGLMLPATARSQVSVNVSIGQPPPVVVARPVMVPVTNSPVYFSPSYGSDLFFYDGRYYTVRDDQWFYAARVNSPWVAISIGKVPQQIIAVPVAYYRVPPGHLKGKGPGPGFCPPGQAKKGRC